MKTTKNTKNSKNIAVPAGTIIDTRKAPAQKAKPVTTPPAPVAAPVVAAAPAAPKPTVAMSPELRFFRETQATVNGWFMVEERGVLIRRRVYEWPRKGQGGQVYISNSGYCVLEMNEAGDGLRVPATWVPTMGKKAGLIATPAPAPVPVVVAPPAAPAKAAAPRSARKMKVA